MFKEQLIAKLDERRQWACNDCRTFLFAKTQTGWREHETWLGGGNMAKPLILFPFWDVMAGIYAHHLPSSENILWTVEDAQRVEDAFQQAKALLVEKAKIEPLIKHLRPLKPKVGDIVSAEKALKVFLEEFKEHATLGVEPKYFAHTTRPQYRNKLAHLYSPKLNGGTCSLSPSPASFGQILN